MRGIGFGPLSPGWWIYKSTKREVRREVRAETKKMSELREHRLREDKLDASNRRLAEAKNKDMTL